MALTKVGSIGVSTGIQFAGVTTIATLNASDNILSVGGTVNFVSDVSIGGTISIGGTLTYEDVTNVDSIGIITARSEIRVGSGITLSNDGDIFATGIITASSFVGSGANLTGVGVDGIVSSADATAITINSSELVGIGTAAPATSLHAYHATTNEVARFESGDSTVALAFRDSATTSNRPTIGGKTDDLFIQTGGSEKLRIKSDGKVLLQHYTSRNVGGAANQRLVQIEGTSKNDSSMSLVNNQNNGSSPCINFGKTRGSSTGDSTIVQDGDTLGAIEWTGADGVDLNHSMATLKAIVNGSPSENTIPTDITFTTGSTVAGKAERLRITSAGRVGINEPAPACMLDVEDGASGGDGITEILRLNGSPNSTNDGIKINFARAGSSCGHIVLEKVNANNTTDLIVSTRSSNTVSESLRILGDGKVLIGHTSNIFNYKLAVFGTDGGNSGISASRFSNNTSPSSIILSKSRGTSIGSYTVVQSGDEVGMIDFRGADGTDNNSKVAEIMACIDGTPGSNDMPGRLVFKTTADGASTATERLRIDNQGRCLFNTTVNDPAADGGSANDGTTISEDGYVSSARNQGASGKFGRNDNDGVIINLYGDGDAEGNISVSGSTVSYNGGHLSRWSQFVGLGAGTRPTIYQGTVLSNLDEMCEWDGEENQQLNKTKVSDTVGDKDVAGVFWSWDNLDPDDAEKYAAYPNDFYIAMTGDMVIRVAGSTSVARGDLMESAGDGTAKPQSDDIVRSKTIAKITSTTSTATYDDGSKAYPCVLMAC